MMFVFIFSIHTCIKHEYLQIYEKLYIHRNKVIVHVYEHLYLGILAIIRVDI